MSEASAGRGPYPGDEDRYPAAETPRLVSPEAAPNDLDPWPVEKEPARLPPASAANGPWRVEPGPAGAEPVRPLFPSPAPGAMRSDHPGAARPSRPTAAPEGVTRPVFSDEPAGVARYREAPPDESTQPIYNAGPIGGYLPGQPIHSVDTTVYPGTEDYGPAPGFGTAGTYGTPMSTAEQTTEERPAEGQRYPDGGAEAVTRTGRGGPVGWRPQAPGVHPIQSPGQNPGQGPAQHPGITPQRPDRRLPVRLETPPTRSRQPLVLIAVLVAGLLIAGAIVFATLPRAGSKQAAAPPASATPPASAPASAAPSKSPLGGAPDNVKLHDNTDSVSLTWGYPKNSEGPVLISGGRVGQEQRAFQQLPAGTTNYVVYGLNNTQDYCFTVAVVYTVDQVAASKPVCTKRR